MSERTRKKESWIWTVAAQSPDRYCSQHLLKSYRIFSHVYPKELASAGNPLSKDQMKCDIWPVIIISKKLTQDDFPKLSSH